MIPLLEASAQNAGLAQLSQQTAALRHAIDLLTRFQDHPLRAEIETATQRYYELPCSRIIRGYPQIGYIDLLYCFPTGWQIVDFKTDSIRSAQECSILVSQYTQQMRKYASAVQRLIGKQAQTRICFLDDHGEISLAEIRSL